ncbi:MAG: metallophosphoesterase [Pseudomonadota bacterium]|nr:metallophosphoesterase [Pseudomonadota bacterium]
MRTLVHLSDLHFGRTDPALIEPLVATVAELEPHLLVVSGDLTQRARSNEFRAARAFLDRLPKPQLVVPGNHDVPLYRVWERFLSPFGKYRRHIVADLEPEHIDDEIAVVGINTARSLTFKNGRINQDQVGAIHRRLDPLPKALTKIVVTHHPFDLPDDPADAERVGRARMAMQVFATCRVDLLLAGHFHTSQTGDTSSHHPLPGYSALVVQAGTATSTRGRGESNSFNVLRLSGDEIAVERQVWQPGAGAFALERSERFRRQDGRWVEGRVGR